MIMASGKQKTNEQSSAQQFVDVEEIRDGVVILKNRAYKAILSVSALNFDLKSSEEQDAIIMQYQNFVNSLDFPLQILIHSRRFNIKPYLGKLKDLERDQENNLLRLQISEYHNFIKGMTEVANIMSKSFYVVVPFSPIENEEEGAFRKMTALFNPTQIVKEKEEMYTVYRNQLLQRVDHISYTLSGSGVKIRMLGTEEVVELLYNTYNPALYTTVLTTNFSGIDLE